MAETLKERLARLKKEEKEKPTISLSSLPAGTNLFDPRFEGAKIEGQITGERDTGILEDVGGLIKRGAGAVKEFAAGAIDQPLETFRGLMVGGARATPIGRAVTKGLEKVFDGKSVAEFQPQTEQEAKAIGVGEFGTRAATGVALSTLVPGGGVLPTLAKGVVANIPFIEKAFEEGGVKGAAFDVALNTALDVVTLGATKAFPAVKSAIKKSFKGLSDAEIGKIATQAIKRANELGGRALEKAKDIIPGVKKDISIPKTQIELANLAAERAGIPLTLAQKRLPLEARKPSGKLARMETFAATTPGGVGRMQQFKQTQVEAAQSKFKQIFGENPIPFDESAEEVTKRLGGEISAMKIRADKAYSEIVKTGSKERLGGKELAEKLKGNLFDNNIGVFTPEKKGNISILVPTKKDIPTGVEPLVGKDLVNWVKRIEKIGDTPTPTNFKAIRGIRQEIGEKIGQYQARGLSGATLGDAKHALGIMYGDLVDFERDHLRKIGGDAILETLDEANEFFRNTLDVRDLTSRLIGFGKEVGERGFVEPNTALINLLKPIESKRRQLIMELMDDEAKKHLKAGLLFQIMDKSFNVDGVVSLAKLKTQIKNIDRGGKNNLLSIVGKETEKEIRDFITGLERARFSEIGLLDAWNPSGTAGSQNIKSFMDKIFQWSGVAGLAGGVGFRSPQVGVGIAATTGALFGSKAYAANLAARIMTSGGFAVEQAIARTLGGAAFGALVGGVAGDEKFKGALVGAGLGLAAGPTGLRVSKQVLKGVAKIGGAR